MNAANESNLKPTAQDPVVAHIGEAMRQSFANGFETAMVRARRIVGENPHLGNDALLRLLEREQPPAV